MALTATARVELMLSLLPWLAAHPGVAKSEAAAQFGISVSQLDRILGTMFVAEIPGHPEWCIDLDFLDEDCVTVLEPQGLDRPLTLRPDEAASLILGLRHLAGNSELAARGSVDSALAKLESVVQGDLPTALDEPAVTPAEEAIVSAIDSGHRVRITYHAANRDEPTMRDVDPMRIVTAEGHRYLQGWCYLAQSVRTFRLDRVADAEVLPELAQPDRPQPPPPTYVAGTDDLRAVLDLAPSARWVPEYVPVESSEELPDGRLRVIVTSPSAAWLRRLVLRLAGAATVVDPPELGEQVRAEAAGALAQYAEPASGT
jgi:proteasome accessory factor C